MLAFDKQEYLDRIENVKLRMMQFGLDVLIVSDPANMNYLTGYDGWSFYTPQAVVVAVAQDEPLCVVRGIDLNGAKVTTFLDEANLIGYPDDYVQSKRKHPMDFLAEVLEARGLGRGNIGLEMDASAFGMGLRSQRFAIVAEDGVVTQLLIEGPGEFLVSSAEHVLTVI